MALSRPRTGSTIDKVQALREATLAQNPTRSKHDKLPSAGSGKGSGSKGTGKG